MIRIDRHIPLRKECSIPGCEEPVYGHKVDRSRVFYNFKRIIVKDGKIVTEIGTVWSPTINENLCYYHWKKEKGLFDRSPGEFRNRPRVLTL